MAESVEIEGSCFAFDGRVGLDDLCACVVEFSLVSSHNDDVHAFAGELLGYCQTDSLGSASDESVRALAVFGLEVDVFGEEEDVDGEKDVLHVLDDEEESQKSDHSAEHL